MQFGLSRPQFRRAPLGGIARGDIERLAQAVFDGQLEVPRSRDPRLTEPCDAAPDRRAIGVLCRHMPQFTTMRLCDLLGYHVIFS